MNRLVNQHIDGLLGKGRTYTVDIFPDELAQRRANAEKLSEKLRELPDISYVSVKETHDHQYTHLVSLNIQEHDVQLVLSENAELLRTTWHGGREVDMATIEEAISLQAVLEIRSVVQHAQKEAAKIAGLDKGIKKTSFLSRVISCTKKKSPRSLL